MRKLDLILSHNHILLLNLVMYLGSLKIEMEVGAINSPIYSLCSIAHVKCIRDVVT